MRCPESQGNSVASACSGIESRGGWRGSTHSTMFAADGFKLSVSVPVEEGTVRGSAQLSGGEARSCGAPPLPAPEPVDVNWQPPIGARAAQTRARPAVDRLLALTLSTDNRGPWAGSRVGVHLHLAIVFLGLARIEPSLHPTDRSIRPPTQADLLKRRRICLHFSAGFRPHPHRPDLDVLAVDHRPEGRRCDGAQGERAGRQHGKTAVGLLLRRHRQAHVLARRVRPHGAVNHTGQQGSLQHRPC